MISIGDKVTVKNAKKYDCFLPNTITGYVYVKFFDGRVGVKTEGGGSISVYKEDILDK